MAGHCRLLVCMPSLLPPSSLLSPSFLDPDRGYYVLNPRGDLPATEKRFHGWFEEGLGWSGVVGHAPSTSQYSEALEQHDVFV